MWRGSETIDFPLDISNNHLGSEMTGSINEMCNSSPEMTCGAIAETWWQHPCGMGCGSFMPLQI